jgi:hypothetical protein
VDIKDALLSQDAFRDALASQVPNSQHLINTEKDIEKFKEDHPFATKKETSLYAKNLWAEKKLQALTNEAIRGSGTNGGNYLTNWFDATDLKTLFLLIASVPANEQ